MNRQSFTRKMSQLRMTESFENWKFFYFHPSHLRAHEHNHSIIVCHHLAHVHHQPLSIYYYIKSPPHTLACRDNRGHLSVALATSRRLSFIDPLGALSLGAALVMVLIAPSNPFTSPPAVVGLRSNDQIINSELQRGYLMQPAMGLTHPEGMRVPKSILSNFNLINCLTFLSERSSIQLGS